MLQLVQEPDIQSQVRSDEINLRMDAKLAKLVDNQSHGTGYSFHFYESSLLSVLYVNLYLYRVVKQSS